MQIIQHNHSIEITRGFSSIRPKLPLLAPAQMTQSDFEWPELRAMVAQEKGARAGNRSDVERVPMRWCRSQKPAKSTASVFPIVAG
jgi:hypothetical protein